jgi:hypothetical protein
MHGNINSIKAPVPGHARRESFLTVSEKCDNVTWKRQTQLFVHYSKGALTGTGSMHRYIKIGITTINEEF